MADRSGETGELRKAVDDLRYRIVQLGGRLRQYRSIFNFSADALFVLDLIDRIVDANPSASEMFGYGRGELLGMTGADLVQAGDERLLDRLWERSDGDRALHVECVGVKKGGERIQVDVTGTRFDYAGEEAALIVIRDITERKRMEEQLKRLASTDELTGLNNRRRFLELAEREVVRARRYRSPLSLILFDLDLFKRVNDNHGHLVGDQVLRALAGVCSDQLRESDILGRLGGEEFAIAAVETDLGKAGGVAERLRRGIADLVVSTEQADIRITCSFGVAQFAEEDGDLEILFNRADEALYRAKEMGRDRVEPARSAGE